MKNTFFGLKNGKGKLPFSIPGQVFYQDFTERRFQNGDSKIFIRPVLLIQASMPLQTEDFCLPCIEDSFMILYLKKGNVRLETEDKYFELTDGSGVVISADRTISIKCKTGPVSSLFLYVAGELMRELYKVHNETPLCFARHQFPDFEQRVISFMNEYLQAESPLLFEFSRHLDQLMTRIVHQSLMGFDKEKYRKQSLMGVVTYMKEHCCEQIQVADIAASLGYSSSHFSRIFQNEFHKSPKKYLLELRISYAEKILVNSSLSIEAIGQECGFNTTTHFIQTFRDNRGVTPLQFRKQYQSEKNSDTDK